jgi:hypothetical protein
MRLSLFAFILLAAQSVAQTPVQSALPAGSIHIQVLSGVGAINYTKGRTNRETIALVEDDNHKPVGAAAVTFLLPSDGPGGVFAGGARSITVPTDLTGRAAMPPIQSNQLTGQFNIQVTAASEGRQATATIPQSNAAGPSPNQAHRGLMVKTLVVVGAAAAGGLGYWASQHCFGGNCSQTPPTPNTIGGATPSFGAPHP